MACLLFTRNGNAVGRRKFVKRFFIRQCSAQWQAHDLGASSGDPGEIILPEWNHPFDRHAHGGLKIGVETVFLAPFDEIEKLFELALLPQKYRNQPLFRLSLSLSLSLLLPRSWREFLANRVAPNS